MKVNRYQSLTGLTILFFFSGAPFLIAQSKMPARAAKKPAKKVINHKESFKLKFINPPALAKPSGYSHVVAAPAGRTLYISGQIALDSNGNLIGAGDFRQQTEQVFKNLKTALDSAGASFTNIVKINIYLTDIPTQLKIFREVRDKYINLQNPPASSLVEVRRLVRDDLLIEIDAVAVAPQK